MLYAMLLNTFINDLFVWERNADIHNFADNKSVPSVLDSWEHLISDLECASKVTFNWFRNNTMIVNPSKFQSIIIDHSKTNYNPQMFNIDGKK